MLDRFTRRDFLRMTGLGVAGALLAACKPETIKEIVKETVEVEKIVTSVVKETVVVEGAPKEVTRVITTTPVPAQPPAEAVRLTLYLQWLPLAVTPQYEQLVADFEAEHPNIRINLENVTAGDSLAQLQARFAADLVPDVFILNSGTYSPFAAKGVLLPLDDFMAVDKEMDKSLFWESALAMGTAQGKLYAMPYSLLPAVEVYNADLMKKNGVELPKAGWTYKDDVVEKALACSNGEGDAQTWGWDSGGTAYDIMSAFEGPWISEDGKHSLLTDPRTVDGFQWKSDMYHTHKVVATAEQTDQYIHIGTGRLGMIKVYAWALSSLYDLEFNWDLVALPTGAAAGSEVWTNAYLMPKAVKHPQEAWELLKYATLKSWTFRQEMPPMKKDMDAWMAADGGKHNLQAFVDALSVPATWWSTLAAHPRIDEINRIINAQWDLVQLGKQDVATMIANAHEELEATLSRED